jgi:hypothetical protein
MDSHGKRALGQNQAVSPWARWATSPATASQLAVPGAGSTPPCPAEDVRDRTVREPGPRARVSSTFGPRSIGTEWFVAVPSGAFRGRSQLLPSGNKPRCRTLIRLPWPVAATRDENRAARPSLALLVRQIRCYMGDFPFRMCSSHRAWRVRSKAMVDPSVSGLPPAHARWQSRAGVCRR